MLKAFFLSGPIRRSLPNELCCSFGASVRNMSSGSQTALIKTLREKSGSPISDVKACLVANNWDLEKAFDALRQKGLAAAAKKASRHASDGLVGLAAMHATDDSSGPAVAVVEINSETDFVARSSLFQNLVSQVTGAALGLEGCGLATQGYLLEEGRLAAARLPSGATAAEACAEVAAQVRENVRLRRGFLLRGPPGSVAASYLHMSPAAGLGSIASVILLQPENGAKLTPSAATAASTLASGIAMHAAGMHAKYLGRSDVPPEHLQRERQVLSAQASSSGKPEAVIAKMVEGRLSKFYEDVCLLEQRYLLDDSVKINAAVDRLSKQIGLKLRIGAFLRVQCGEGLDAADKTDFATEVARMANN